MDTREIKVQDEEILKSPSKVIVEADVTEISKYVDVTEAGLALGTGTYRGTIAPTPPKDEQP